MMELNTELARQSHRAWTGSRMIDVLNPDPADIILTEIAVGLSRETRYGGAATIVPWSVAQHCLLCDHYAEEDGVTSAEIRLMLLLHDAPEYMIRDMIAPVKRQLPEYRSLEAVWWTATARKFALPFELPGIVKHYDMLAASSERDALIHRDAGEWPDLPAPRPIPEDILGLTTISAERRFLDTVVSLLASRASRGNRNNRVS
jgi:uncharacterized protein